MRRRDLLVNKLVDNGFVDLGLPSGLKWAKGNLKKSDNTCVIGEESDYGDFWSWANVGLTNDTGWMSSAGGVMTLEMYNSTTGASKDTDISGTDAAHDVAYKYLGAPCRLPTISEFEELYNNTDYEWTTINRISGGKCMKKTDHSVYVFFPASSYCNANGLDTWYRGYYGYYWSSQQNGPNGAYSRYFTNNGSFTQNDNFRSTGMSIRPVQ